MPGTPFGLLGVAFGCQLAPKGYRLGSLGPFGHPFFLGVLVAVKTSKKKRMPGFGLLGVAFGCQLAPKGYLFDSLLMPFGLFSGFVSW